jgi:hypothetical protein
LQLLDLRNGYTPQAVFSTLQAWGPEGRLLYFFVEAVDVTVYHAGYRGAFLVIFNRVYSKLAQQWPQLTVMRPLAALPIVLAAVDFCEDCAQVAVVAALDDSWRQLPEQWAKLVQVASALNQAKWALVNVGTVILSSQLVGLAGTQLYCAINPDSSKLSD